MRVLIKNQDVIWREVDGETVLLNPVTGRYFGLNKVACSFWNKVDGKTTIDEIIDQMLEEYEVEREVLARDIEELVNTLTRFELLL
ncbi:MAG: PqqD family protein [Syntrophomonadaceae bacterium]|nr:PqqD family protein [Syntrophomonadaceae bacterium]